MNTKTKTLITIMIPSALLGVVITLVGPANVIDAAARRDQDQVLVVASIDTDKLNGTKLQGLPAAASLRNQGQIGDTIQKLDLDRTKWARIGTIERRNGFYAVVADADFQNTPGFNKIMDQVKKKEVKTFDTTFAHLDESMDTWIGKKNRAPRLAYLGTSSIRAARFDTLGLYLAAVDSQDLVLFPYGKLDAWLGTSSQNIEGAHTVFTAERTIYSLSHINESRLVVNLNGGHKTTIDLSPLCEDLGIKVLDMDDTDDTTNFVGFRENATDTVAIVDWQEQTVRFAPTAQLSGALAKYADQPAA